MGFGIKISQEALIKHNLKNPKEFAEKLEKASAKADLVAAVNKLANVKPGSEGHAEAVNEVLKHSGKPAASAPTVEPTSSPEADPAKPTGTPTLKPTDAPTAPIQVPTVVPTAKPTPTEPITPDQPSGVLTPELSPEPSKADGEPAIIVYTLKTPNGNKDFSESEINSAIKNMRISDKELNALKVFVINNSTDNLPKNLNEVKCKTLIDDIKTCKPFIEGTQDNLSKNPACLSRYKQYGSDDTLMSTTLLYNFCAEQKFIGQDAGID